MSYKKLTWQGYYNKQLWSKGSPKSVKRYYMKMYRNHLKKEMNKDIDNIK